MPPKPKGNCVHLIRTINDGGIRIDIEPTMKRITVDGIRYNRTSGCWIDYEDGKTGTMYIAEVSAKEFLEIQTLPPTSNRRSSESSSPSL